MLPGSTGSWFRQHLNWLSRIFWGDPLDTFHLFSTHDTWCQSPERISRFRSGPLLISEVISIMYDSSRHRCYGQITSVALIRRFVIFYFRVFLFCLDERPNILLDCILFKSYTTSERLSPPSWPRLVIDVTLGPLTYFHSRRFGQKMWLHQYRARYLKTRTMKLRVLVVNHRKCHLEVSTHRRSPITIRILTW